jgi:CBS domain-containing protein
MASSLLHSAPPGRAGLRSRAERGSHLLALRREVAGALVSVAGLAGRPVRDGERNVIGTVADVVVRWDAGYSPVTGLIVRVGQRRTWLHIADVASIEQSAVSLRSTRFDLRDVVRREGELQLLADVIDHQLVDVSGVQVVRASDLYLTQVHTVWRLVGVDVSLTSLLRRSLPGGLGRRPSPGLVLDWSSVQPFGVPGGSVRLARSHSELRRMRSADLADLLATLGRAERRELLGGLEPGTAADALEEMNARDLNELLRDAPVEQAAELVAAMEADEAVEALREMPPEERDELLDAMEADRGAELEALLQYNEESAGGVMTSRLVRLPEHDTVRDAVAEVRRQVQEGETPAGVVVVDEHGALLDDIEFVELLGADPETPLAALVGPPWPVTVGPDAGLSEIVERMTDNRGSSLLVVDEANRPIGRILADDVVDLLARPGERRWPWQRLSGGAQ